MDTCTPVYDTNNLYHYLIITHNTQDYFRKNKKDI